MTHRERERTSLEAYEEIIAAGVALWDNGSGRRGKEILRNRLGTGGRELLYSLTIISVEAIRKESFLVQEWLLTETFQTAPERGVSVIR